MEKLRLTHRIRKIIKGEKVESEIKVPVELVTQDTINSYKGW